MLNPFVIFLRKILALYNKVLLRICLLFMRKNGKIGNFLWTKQIMYLRRYRRYNTQYIISKK